MTKVGDATVYLLVGSLGRGDLREDARSDRRRSLADREALLRLDEHLLVEQQLHPERREIITSKKQQNTKKRNKNSAFLTLQPLRA